MNNSEQFAIVELSRKSKSYLLYTFINVSDALMEAQLDGITDIYTLTPTRAIIRIDPSYDATEVLACIESLLTVATTSRN